LFRTLFWLSASGFPLPVVHCLFVFGNLYKASRTAGELKDYGNKDRGRYYPGR
jgi:hypothetical protein